MKQVCAGCGKEIKGMAYNLSFGGGCIDCADKEFLAMKSLTNEIESKKKEEVAKTGIKFDQDKPRMSLLPSGPLMEVAEVMTMGAKKYSPHNYRKGMNHSRLLDAAMRHMAQFNKGEKQDEESGKSHLAHAIASLLMLLELQSTWKGKDDIWKGFVEDDKVYE